MYKKIAVIIVAMMILLGVFSLSGCSQKADKYTEEEHLQRVTERIQARYIDGDEKIRQYDRPDDDKIYPKIKATGFEIYPLYDKNDDLKYFLVEFHPFGYLFVSIRNEQLKGFSWLGASTSMYMLSSTEGEPAWTPYTIDTATGIEIWETDEDGKKITYAQSPFSVRGIKDEKRYFLNFDDGYIPTVKRDGRFVNLISNSEFEISNGQITEKQPIEYVSFISKKYFDL